MGWVPHPAVTTSKRLFKIESLLAFTFSCCWWQGGISVNILDLQHYIHDASLHAWPAPKSFPPFQSSTYPMTFEGDSNEQLSFRFLSTGMSQPNLEASPPKKKTEPRKTIPESLNPSPFHRDLPQFVESHPYLRSLGAYLRTLKQMPCDPNKNAPPLVEVLPLYICFREG